LAKGVPQPLSGDPAPPAPIVTGKLVNAVTVADDPPGLPSKGDAV
jgi:hypothetical protein